MKTYEIEYEYVTEGHNEKTYKAGLTLRKMKNSFWQELCHTKKQQGNLQFIRVREENNKEHYCVFYPQKRTYEGLMSISNPLSRSAVEKLFQRGILYLNIQENKTK